MNEKDLLRHREPRTTRKSSARRTRPVPKVFIVIYASTQDIHCVLRTKLAALNFINSRARPSAYTIREMPVLKKHTDLFHVTSVET